MLIRGQRVFVQGVFGVVLDYAEGFVTVDLADGDVAIVAETQVMPAESAESAQDRAKVALLTSLRCS